VRLVGGVRIIKNDTIIFMSTSYAHIPNQATTGGNNPSPTTISTIATSKTTPFCWKKGYEVPRSNIVETMAYSPTNNFIPVCEFY